MSLALGGIIENIRLSVWLIQIVVTDYFLKLSSLFLMWFHTHRRMRAKLSSP